MKKILFTHKRIINITAIIIAVLCIFYIINGNATITQIMRSFLNNLGIYTKEIRKVNFESSTWQKNTPGSWNITKSANWTSKTTANISFKIESIKNEQEHLKDIIFVLDISGSMAGEKIQQVKNDSIEVIKYLLEENELNNIAIISFSNEATIISDFTNDIDRITSYIMGIEVTGETNYNDALEKVEILLKNYEKESKKRLEVLFLTDGYPTKEHPEQVSTFARLKECYPYLEINGVQYEMGYKIVKDIKDISDFQYIADMESLNNKLIEIVLESEPYTKFNITDYINDKYFYVDSINDIQTSIGEVSLLDENGIQKIVWDIPNNQLRTGSIATLDISINLKDEYIDIKGLYPTNLREKITSSISSIGNENVDSEKTPVLKNHYDVIYDTNPPEGCHIKEITTETYFVFDEVTSKYPTLSCSGYIFKGWKIEEENITSINNEKFIMPENDVHIRATWTKAEISKSMDGTVYEKMTLYKVIKNEFESKSGYAELYNGLGADSYANNVYYYKGAVNNNNVLFANFCWKMIRTTDTGGVKMIYNGLPSESGTCNNTGTASQLETKSSINPSYWGIQSMSYMYNKTYEFAEYAHYEKDNILAYVNTDTNYYYYSKNIEITSTGYKLTNPIQFSSIDNYESLSGYYRCKNGTLSECETMYYITGATAHQYYVIKLENNKTLETQNITMKLSDSITENSDGSYTLNNPQSIQTTDWFDMNSDLKNYYICENYTDTTCKDMYYVVFTSNYELSKVNISKSYTFGNSFSYDGTKYTLNDTIQLKNWHKNYNQISNHHYTCYQNNQTCEKLYYVYSSSASNTYHIEITDGKTIEKILEDLTTVDDINVKNSAIKTVVDTWYENNLLEYTKYLEDTIYCNDRKITTLAGLNPNGGLNGLIWFNGGSNKLLVCPNTNDRFTVNSQNGNGALKYPVGLITSNEIALSEGSFKSDEDFWTMTPGYYLNYYSVTYHVQERGYTSLDRLSNNNIGVRPVISLKPETTYKSGHGTINDPYIIDVNE